MKAVKVGVFEIKSRSEGALPVCRHDNPLSASLTRDVSGNLTDPTVLQPRVCVIRGH